MAKASLSARQQDTNKVKVGIPEWFMRTTDPTEPQIGAVPRDKTGRGFNHYLTARALCPRVHIYPFDHDEMYVLDAHVFVNNAFIQIY
jgi:hypothetical protein